MSAVFRAIPILIAVSIPSAAFAGGEPWYERASCHEAMELGFATEFQKADAKIAQLEASRDADDQACALWARVSLSELKIAVLGSTPELTAARKKALSRLFGFSKAHRSKGARFGDLELEARLRRVRVLLEEGSQRDAMNEAKLVQEMLDKRPSAPQTPTADYVVGVLNAALASPGWAGRALLSVVGLGSNKERGAQAINKLADGSSIYKVDAMYIGHHFSIEVEDAGFRKPIAYSKPLLARFPNNPQFLFDVAMDLQREKRYADALKVARQAASRIDAQPDMWSAKIRAKIYWITGRSAFDTGDRAEAKRRAELARAQNFEELEDNIDDLFDDIEG